MNNRIRELESLAYVVKDYSPYYENFPIDAPRSVTSFDREKFAELIVKECMSCCDVVKKVEWIDPPTYELGVEACKVKIQTHFGVEKDA